MKSSQVTLEVGQRWIDRYGYTWVVVSIWGNCAQLRSGLLINWLRREALAEHWTLVEPEKDVM